MSERLKRLYEPEAYAAQSDLGTYWRSTVAVEPEWSSLTSGISCEVAIIGGGYTGLSAALHLAEAGVDVVLLEAEAPGWGASGRNGGFVCLGGAKASDRQIQARYGASALSEFRQAQRSAIDLVDALLDAHEIDADRHSDGEVILAHRPRDLEGLKAEAEHLGAVYSLGSTYLDQTDLAARGMVGGPFHGALHVPLGFALNPRKYALGLAGAAQAAGARIAARSPVIGISGVTGKHYLQTPNGALTAKSLIVATNGYSSDNLPGWLSGRYLPVQSNIIVTRQLTQAEIGEGWRSDLMAYDTRNLLHYFRLLPEGRFLFGMRGGIRADASAQRAMRRNIRADFESMFPIWAHVETPHFWSGLACLSRDLTPYIGPLGDLENAHTAIAYHGNGVALATYSGKLLAGRVTGQGPPVPEVMQGPLRRFPLGRWRRTFLRAAYRWYRVRDR